MKKPTGKHGIHKPGEPPDENRILMFLGLATRAGKTAAGYDIVSQAVLSGKAHLVLCATDASENTTRRIRNLAQETDTPFRRFSTRDKLGRFTGKDDRAVVGILDQGFSDRLITMIPDNDTISDEDRSVDANG